VLFFDTKVVDFVIFGFVTLYVKLIKIDRSPGSHLWRGIRWVKNDSIIEIGRWSKSLDFGLPIKHYSISALMNSRSKEQHLLIENSLYV